MQKLAQELADEETGNPELVPVKSVRLKKKHQSVKELQAVSLSVLHCILVLIINKYLVHFYLHI